MYGKPGISGENSNETFHPVGNCPERSNTFRGITFFPFLPKRPKLNFLHHLFGLPEPGIMSRESKKFTGLL